MNQTLKEFDEVNFLWKMSVSDKGFEIFRVEKDPDRKFRQFLMLVKPFDAEEGISLKEMDSRREYKFSVARF